MSSRIQRQKNPLRSRGNRRVTCGVKVRYRTRQDAYKQLESCRMMGSERIPVRAYSCRVCQGWHLTSKPARMAASAVSLPTQRNANSPRPGSGSDPIGRVSGGVGHHSAMLTVLGCGARDSV